MPLLYHLGVLPNGYLGVDLFFVVDGYFITKGLIRRMVGGEFGYLRWIGQRLARLWPLVALAVLASLAIGYFTMLPDDLENLGSSAVACNLFANNILSAITTRNYWDVVNDYKPLMHLWYVGVLMQCYVVYPLIFMGLGRLSGKKKQVYIWGMGVLCAASLTVCFLPHFTARRSFITSRSVFMNLVLADWWRC